MLCADAYAVKVSHCRPYRKLSLLLKSHLQTPIGHATPQYTTQQTLPLRLYQRQNKKKKAWYKETHAVRNKQKKKIALQAPTQRHGHDPFGLRRTHGPPSGRERRPSGLRRVSHRAVRGSPRSQGQVRERERTCRPARIPLGKSFSLV